MALLITACSQEQSDIKDTVSDAMQEDENRENSPQTQSAPAPLPLVIFPAQERELASPEVISRGETVYESLCRACHGRDLRGGDQGGPNLLRSQVVLNDQHGELIGEVIQNGRSNPGMPPMPPLQVSPDDRVAVAEFIHSVWANQSGQGGPPPGEEVELDILVGDATAGEAYFNSNCTGCHSVTGDLQGIAGKISSPEYLQNSWVAGRRWGSPDPEADPARRQVTVSVQLDNGEIYAGTFNRRDDFFISLTTDEGRRMSFALHKNASPRVMQIEVNDPMQGHRDLLSELTNEIMHDVTAYLVTLQ